MGKGKLLGYNFSEYPAFYQNFQQYGNSNRIYNDRVDLENSGSIVDFGDSLKQEISVNNFPSMFEFDKTFQGIINRKVNSLHHPNKEEHKIFADYLHNTLNKLNYLN